MSVGWLFLDMNSFFASVEQQEHPELRGKPVAVVPMVSDSTCCIAASYEAKAYGVKTGTNVAEAKRLCPNLRLVEAKSHDPYRKYQIEIVRAVQEYLPVTEIWSVDELVCKLWANERHLSDAIRVGEQIKARIKADVGECMHCSVGLGLNPFLAKVAAELQKPNGLVVLDTDDLPHKLFGLALTDFPGINRRMEARFQVAGVRTTEQMCALTLEQMRGIWGGVVGERWWHLLRGHQVAMPPRERKSVGHSHVLAPALRTPAGAASVAGRLLEKAAERMRHHGYQARGLSVHVRADDGRTWMAKRRLTPCVDTWTLMAALRSLWEHPFPKVRQVGVVLYDLLPDTQFTASLFGEDMERRTAARTVDAINGKYGRGTVSMASVVPVKAAAEDKIAFGKIGEMD
jgi:DNA polymerase-4